jgi:oligopeptide/dipeptide ABC transporter ATP-binding protein
MELIVELQERLGMAVIMISHDLGLAASYAQDVAVMYAGRAVEYAAAGDLFGAVRMPYTRALLDAIPLLERGSHELLPVTPGQPPDLSKLPTGCPFRPRCGNASDRCLEHPDFLEHQPGHWWACHHPVAERPELAAATAAPVQAAPAATVPAGATAYAAPAADPTTRQGANR